MNNKQFFHKNLQYLCSFKNLSIIPASNSHHQTSQNLLQFSQRKSQHNSQKNCSINFYETYTNKFLKYCPIRNKRIQSQIFVNLKITDNNRILKNMKNGFKKQTLNKKNQTTKIKIKSHTQFYKQQRSDIKNYMSRLTFYTPEKISNNCHRKSKNQNKSRNASNMKSKKSICKSANNTQTNNTQSKNSNNYLNFLSRIVDRVGYQMIKKHNPCINSNDPWITKQIQNNRRQLENKFIPNRDLIKTISHFSRKGASLNNSKINQQNNIDKYSFLNRIEIIYKLAKQRQRLTPFTQYFLGNALYQLKFKQALKLKQFEDACLQIFNNADKDDLNLFMKQKIPGLGIRFENSQSINKNFSQRESSNQKPPSCIFKRYNTRESVNHKQNKQILTHDKRGSPFNTKSTFVQSQIDMAASYLPKGKSLAIKSNNQVVTLKRLEEKLNTYINKWGKQIPSKNINIYDN